MKPSRQPRRLGVLLACLVVFASITLSGAPAQALGTTKGCHSYNYVSSTNDWHFFWAHKVRAYERACISAFQYHAKDYPYLRWVRKPSVSHPSIPLLPSAEKITTTKAPFLKRWTKLHGRYTHVTWGFSMSNQLNDFDFELRVNTRYDQLCVVHSGGDVSCDKKKYW